MVSTVVGQTFTIPRPDVSDELLANMMTAVWRIVAAEG
jgi:hypothetical protein